MNSEITLICTNLNLHGYIQSFKQSVDEPVTIAMERNDNDEELKLSNTHFDAIKLLEGALQKMDGIISLGTNVYIILLKQRRN